MAFLSNWNEDNRVKVTIDNTNIDSDLTHFPIPIVLGTSVGQSNQDVSEIFDALVYPYRPESVDDDFTGNDNDLPNPNLWALDGSPVIDSNKLQMEGSAFSKATSIYSLTGDFDVQVDLDVIVGPSTDSWSLGLGVWWENTDFVMMARRYSTGQRYESLRRISGSFTTISTATTSDTTCKFKITRSGSTLSFFKWGGSSWDAYSTYTGSTDDVQIFLEHGGWSGNPSFTGDFDNFVVNSGTIVWHEAEDHFTGADDDLLNPDLWTTVYVGNTELSIQSNKWYWEDSGAADQAGVSTSIFVLQGDFDFQIDFENISRTAPSSSISYLASLSITNAAATLNNRITNLLNPAHKYSTHENGESSVYIDTTVYAGKLRFKRVSGVMTSYYWSGTQWEWDGSTAGHTYINNNTDDLYVKITATADFDGATESTFDNFIVNSGTIIWPENTQPNRRKIAITKDDGTTQIFGEIEHWDSINEKAVIWTSKHDLVLDNADTTDLYLYYDPAQDSNDNYIGDTGEVNIVTHITGDDFTGTNGDSPDKDLWGLYYDDQDSGDSSGTHQISSNKLAFSLTTTKTFPVTQSNFKLTGDFDIQVDFSMSIPSPDAAWAVGLALGFGNIDLFGDSKFAHVSRFTTGSGPYLSGTYNGTDPKEGSDDTTGKFRLVRSGNELLTYYWGGSSWTLYLTDSAYGSHDIYVKLFTRTWGTTTTLNGTFDNFLINSGTVKYTPSQRVWDANYKAVYHMAQDPSGGADAILDSTVNVNHGTSSGTMLTADLVSGEIGKAIDFDGVDDQIEIAADATLNDFAVGAEFTIESVIYPRTIGEGSTGRIVAKRPLVPDTSGGWLFFMDSVASLGFQSIGSGVEAHQRGSDNEITLNSHIICCLTYDDDDSRKGDISADAVEIAYDTDTAATGANVTDDSGPLMIGNTASGNQDRSFDGLIEMVRLSNSVRSTAWLKGTNYSLKDDLLTFDFEDTTTALIDMALDIKAFQDSTQDIKSDLIVATYGTEDTQMSIAAYLQHLSDLKTDLSLYATTLQNMVFDAILSSETNENTKTDIAMYFQGMDDTKLDLKTWQSMVEHFPLDSKVAVEVREDGKLDLLTAYVALEDLKQFMLLTQSIIDSEASLDFSVGDGIIVKDNKLDINVNDGNKIEDVGLHLVIVATSPIYKAIYGLHLESAVKEII